MPVTNMSGTECLHRDLICFLHTIPTAALEIFKVHALWVGAERDLSEVTREGTKGFLIHTAQSH